MARPWERNAINPTLGGVPGSDAQAVANEAVKQGVTTSAAQSVGGTVATVGATPVGATGVTVAQNLGFSAVGNVATNSPEIPGLAWIVTFLFQGVKRVSWINQNTAKWFLLPLFGFLVACAVYWLTNDGNVGLAIARAIQNCGLVAVNAVTNYKTLAPLGVLGPAENP